MRSVSVSDIPDTSLQNEKFRGNIRIERERELFLFNVIPPAGYSLYDTNIAISRCLARDCVIPAVPFLWLVSLVISRETRNTNNNYNRHFLISIIREMDSPISSLCINLLD